MPSIPDLARPAPHPGRTPLRPATPIAAQRDYYLGELLAQAHRDAALCPDLVYCEATVREHLISRANPSARRDDARELAWFRDRLLAVARRVAQDWSLPFDLNAARARFTAAALTPHGTNPNVDTLRARGRGDTP